MRDKLFIDAVFAIALVSKRDQYHEQAIELSKRFESYPLVVTDAVLLEVGNALARNHRQEAIEVIQYSLTSNEVEIVYLTPQLFGQAFELYRSHQDKAWSLVDCISFIVMRTLDMSSALTFDKHFVQAGFQALMREDAST